MGGSRAFAVLCAAAGLVLCLAACGGGGGSSETTSTSSTTGSTTTTPTPGGHFKAAFNTDTAGLNDKSFNHLGNLGRLKAQKDLGIETKVYVSASESDYLPNAVAAAQGGAQAVVMNGFLLADATNTAAKQFPDVKWAITDFPRVALADQPANAYGLTFKSEQSGFLVGYLAAEMAKAKLGPTGASSGKLVLSAVGGKKIPSVDNWIAGYRAGAKAVDPSFKVLIDYSGDFTPATRRSARSSRSSTSRRARRPSSRSPAAAASAPCRLRSRRRSGASASTPTSPTSARTSSRAASSASTRPCTRSTSSPRGEARPGQGPRLRPEEQGPGRRQDQHARAACVRHEDERREGEDHQRQASRSRTRSRHAIGARGRHRRRPP